MPNGAFVTLTRSARLTASRADFSRCLIACEIARLNGAIRHQKRHGIGQRFLGAGSRCKQQQRQRRNSRRGRRLHFRSTSMASTEPSGWRYPRTSTRSRFSSWSHDPFRKLVSLVRRHDCSLQREPDRRASPGSSAIRPLSSTSGGGGAGGGGVGGRRRGRWCWRRRRRRRRSWCAALVSASVSVSASASASALASVLASVLVLVPASAPERLRSVSGLCVRPRR